MHNYYKTNVVRVLVLTCNIIFNTVPPHAGVSAGHANYCIVKFSVKTEMRALVNVLKAFPVSCR